MHANLHTQLDGFERWFFGGTPGPFDLEAPSASPAPAAELLRHQTAAMNQASAPCPCDSLAMSLAER